jgi:hypothetical protein
MVGRAAHDGVRIFAEDPQRQRIREDAAALEDLMRGPMRRRAPGSAAALCTFHSGSLAPRYGARPTT